MSAEQHLTLVERDGFAIVRNVFLPVHVDAMLAGLERAFAAQSDAVAIRSGAGSVYAARNVLALWPEAAIAWRQPPLPTILAALMGPSFGLVRALFFDKPPERNWALPWHQDLTIAVRDNRRLSRVFKKPTVKAGVPHVEAPRAVLEQMLTMRIHLDRVTAENGPLKVLPSSHRLGTESTEGTTPVETILAERGDALLMRPLLFHSSGHAYPDSVQHRRILHLEFAASAELPDGYAWNDFRQR